MSIFLGLSMTVFVNQKQYIPGLGNQAGISFLIWTKDLTYLQD